MHRFALWIYLIILNTVKCEKVLRIFRHAEDNYTPITTHFVQERAGANLTLTCELWSNVTDNSIIDDRITWGRVPLLVKREELTEKLYKWHFKYVQTSDVNKAVKSFVPLKLDDAGAYFCVSYKYGLLEVIQIAVGNINPLKHHLEYKDPLCVDTFKCVLNGVCIHLRYVCDGKRDCRDGSDESDERCGGDPCKDKIKCDDRCIPKYWCCDRHLDSNCNVTYRPLCCPMDITEYPYNITQPKQRHSDFVFIAFFCFLGIFVMIIILVGVFILMSKMFLLVNKQSFGPSFEDINDPFRFTNGNCNRLILSNVRYTNSDENGQEMSDLLRGRDYQAPPSYSEIERLEQPPPYTSNECLNGR